MLRLNGLDRRRDVAGGGRRRIGERLDLVCHHRKAGAGIACARRFDRGVERQQIRLQRQRVDRLDHRVDVAAADLQPADGGARGLRGLGRAGGDTRGLVRRAPDLVDAGVDALGGRGQLRDVAADLVARLRQRARLVGRFVACVPSRSATLVSSVAASASTCAVPASGRMLRTISTLMPMDSSTTTRLVAMRLRSGASTRPSTPARCAVERLTRVEAHLAQAAEKLRRQLLEHQRLDGRIVLVARGQMREDLPRLGVGVLERVDAPASDPSSARRCRAFASSCQFARQVVAADRVGVEAWRHGPPPPRAAAP